LAPGCTKVVVHMGLEIDNVDLVFRCFQNVAPVWFNFSDRLVAFRRLQGQRGKNEMDEKTRVYFFHLLLLCRLIHSVGKCSRKNIQSLQGDLGSMLWSQFSVIFTNFRQKNWRFYIKKPNVMVKFLLKQAVVWARNANIFEIITLVPDRANFRTLGGCFPWAVF
jgi:hypothetical protein